MLGQSLEHVGCETILVVDDTELRVLLCFHVKEDSCQVFLKPEIRSGTKKSPRCGNIKYVQRVLVCEVSNNMLLAGAILGCDTNPRVFTIGQGLAPTNIRSDIHFIAQAEIFLQENTTLAGYIKRRRSSPSMPVHRCSG